MSRVREQCYRRGLAQPPSSTPQRQAACRWVERNRRQCPAWDSARIEYCVQVFGEMSTAVLAGLALLTFSVVVLSILGRSLNVLAPTLAALGLRLAVAVFNFVGGRSLVGDEMAYDRDALDLVSNWRGLGPPPDLSQGKEGWPVLLAHVYSNFGHAPELAILLNVIVAAMTVLVVAASCRALGWNSSARAAAWIAALWPTAVLWGPMLLREAIVTLLLAFAFLGTALLGNRRVLAGLPLLVISGTLMTWMRGGMLYFVLIVLPVSAVLATIVTSRRTGRGYRVLAVSAAMLVVLLPSLTSSLQDSVSFDADRQQVVAEALNKGTTSYGAAGLSTDNSVLMFVYTAVGPPPTALANPGLLAAGIDAMLWLAMWFFAVYGWRKLPDARWGLLVCMVPSAVLLLYLSEIATNFGLIMRMRALLIPLMAPAAAIGVKHWISQRRRRNHKRKPAPFGSPLRANVGTAVSGNTALSNPTRKGDSSPTR